MTIEQLQEQNEGLRRRIEVLEKQNEKLTKAVSFTLKTIERCRDKSVNPLETMIDRSIAENLMAEAIK